MKTVWLKPRSDFDRKAFMKKDATDEHYSQVVERPAKLVCETGEVLGFLVEPRPLLTLRNALRSIKYVQDYRTDAMQSNSRTFGYQPRVTLRRDFCSVAATAREFPDEHDMLIHYGMAAAKQFQELMPDVHERQVTQLRENILEHWRVNDDAPFTSGIVNNTFSLRYHRDSGNFHDAWSMMYVLSKDIQGGRLVIPEYDVALDFAGEDLLIFQGERLVHGNTPMRRINDRGYRYSVVYYPLAGLQRCGTPREELARIRKLKTQRAKARHSREQDKLRDRVKGGK